MFEIGDLVEIDFHGNESAVMPGCPALNLQGTIAKIKNRSPHPVFRDEYKYSLKFISVHAQEKELYDESQENLAWRADHLRPVVEEIDISSVLMG